MINPKWRTAGVPSVLGLLALVSVVSAMAIEQARYRVAVADGDIELRQYDARIVAETTVSGDFADVGNEGFRRLVAYIKGANKTQAKIAMTAPVTQSSRSEEIEMTAPVTQEQQDGSYRIAFLMPSRYSLATLPTPDDSRVRLVAEPARWFAVIRYSGTWSESRFRSHETMLRRWVAAKQLTPTGEEPVWARYDPPFMPWFLRRNEILLAVTGQPPGTGT